MAMSGHLLSNAPAEAGLVQSCEYLGVVEISGNVKGFRVFGRRMALHTRDRLERVIDSGDAFAAAEVHAFNFQGLDFFSFGTGALGDLNTCIAAFTEVSGGPESVGRFLSCGRVGRGDSYGFSIAVRRDGRAGDFADGVLRAFHAALAAEVDVAELEACFSGTA